MKLRRFIKGIVFTSLSVILVSTSVQAKTVDDKNRLSLDEFSIEDQDEIINALSQAGYSNVLEEEEVDIADEASELDTISVSKLDLMNQMTKMGSSSDNQVRKGLSFEGCVTISEAEKHIEETGDEGISEFSIVSNSSDEVDVNSIKPSVVTGVPDVSDEEVKADFRYGLDKKQQIGSDGYIITNRANNALKMRIQLEKMFDTKVDMSGGEGRLYDHFFAGSATTGKASAGCTMFARAYVNSQHSKDLENNKVYLAQLAKQTFADIDGTESYAYLIPTSVYYGLIDVEVVNADKAAKSNGKYKEGDLLCHAHDNLTYAKLSKMTAGYDGETQEATWGKLKGTEYAYMGNIHTSSASSGVLTPALAGKEVLKGELIEQIMNQSYLVHFIVMSEGDNLQAMAKTFKDTPKLVDYGSGDDIDSAKMRQVFLNLAANPSKGVPLMTGYALVGADKAGLNVKDSKGNSNWTKKVTVGEAIEYWTQAARVDE